MEYNTEDKLASLLKELKEARARMELAKNLEDVVDNLHKLSHDQCVTLYNAVVQRLMVKP